MKERIQKIKQHLKDNRRVYLACGGTAVVAAVGTLLVTRRDELSIFKQEINQPLSWKPTAHNSIEVHIEALGDPGNIIQDTTTGTVYASQGQAARELGVSPSRVSEHLSGKLLDVGGHHLVKLGKAQVAE